jgi:hypothetical protein
LIPAVLGLPRASCAEPPDLPLPTNPNSVDSMVDRQRDEIDPASSLTVSQTANGFARHPGGNISVRFCLVRSLAFMPCAKVTGVAMAASPRASPAVA